MAHNATCICSSLIYLLFDSSSDRMFDPEKLHLL